MTWEKFWHEFADKLLLLIMVVLFATYNLYVSQVLKDASAGQWARELVGQLVAAILTLVVSKARSNSTTTTDGDKTVVEMEQK
jgi:hypothetical protein